MAHFEVAKSFEKELLQLYLSPKQKGRSSPKSWENVWSMITTGKVGQ